MSIFGDGEYAPQLEKDIIASELCDLVHLRGNLDFKSELVPLVTNEADLFVCCHRQGDPSCTYLETMSCGVPIAGYGNEAWEKLSRFSETGWSSPSGDPGALAELICDVLGRPGEVEYQSRRSLAFARSHTFEKTFARRVEHIANIANAYRAGSYGGPGFMPDVADAAWSMTATRTDQFGPHRFSQPINALMNELWDYPTGSSAQGASM
jgi:glycosyltransferase involved in cell wall biosynthesis